MGLNKTLYTRRVLGLRAERSERWKGSIVAHVAAGSSGSAARPSTSDHDHEPVGGPSVQGLLFGPPPEEASRRGRRL
jgi:hypothetical protein